MNLPNFARKGNNMTRGFHITIFIIILSVLTACGSADVEVRQDEPSAEITALIKETMREVSSQHFDAAMEKALAALEKSRQSGSALGEVRALSSIVGIDIMACRDADAWEKALEAEALARRHGFKEELSKILISKAKLCSYAEISRETGRNEEGLEYAQEALALAEETGAVEEQTEACYVIGSLYINKNRWNDPIDQEIYALAGEWLDKGQSLADTNNLSNLKRNGIMFRSRWFQQGDRNEEAISHFEQVFEGLEESDYLTAAALDDRLVRLYTRIGNAQKALEIHDDYVFRMQKYIQQKQDETLQEMETYFDVQEKERRLEKNRYQITLLLMAIFLAAAIIGFITVYLMKERRRAEEIKRLSDNKEQLIELLAKDLKNPDNDIAGDINRLATDSETLSTEEIREQCRELVAEAESSNPEVADYVGEILIKRKRKIADSGLSQREIQIIRLRSEGLKASEIAARLFLSVHTVNTHHQRIYAKMDVKNVTEMLCKAKDLGII